MISDPFTSCETIFQAPPGLERRRQATDVVTASTKAQFLPEGATARLMSSSGNVFLALLCSTLVFLQKKIPAALGFHGAPFRVDTENRHKPAGDLGTTVSAIEVHGTVDTPSSREGDPCLPTRMNSAVPPIMTTRSYRQGEAGNAAGEARRLLWKPKRQQKFYSVSLEQFERGSRIQPRRETYRQLGRR